MRTCRTIAELRTALESHRTGTIGLVPTMGALHDGHLALLEAAREECETVVMSLFVNPTQFEMSADLNGYPRDEERDLAIAADAGVDFVFAPTVAEMYPPGFQTWVDVTEIGSALEGAFRPGHFRGVATVCLKLFAIIQPDLVYFGQKDAQQVEVLRRMISDLALDLELRSIPTVRDADGLALSSRNARLSADERRRALALPEHSRLVMPQPHGARSKTPASTSTTSSRRRSTLPCSPPPSASAQPGSSTTSHSKEKPHEHHATRRKARAAGARRDEASRREDRDGHRLRHSRRTVRRGRRCRP